MNKFQRAVQNGSLLSPLMEGRDQLKTEELIGKTVTVIAFDIVNVIYQSGDEKPIPILVFEEYKDKYYMGNPRMFNICKELADEYNGDIRAASTDLGEAGGFQFHF